MAIDVKKTILIVDDHAPFRTGFRDLLQTIPGIGIIVEADSGDMAISLANEKRPDLIFMDISMPHIDGIEATRRILSEHPAMKIAMLSVHANKTFLEKCMEAGARGYLVKKSLHGELAQAIEMIMKDELFVSKTIAN